MATKNEKQMINEFCQKEKRSNPIYTCTTDKEPNHNGFFCTLKVGDETFVTPNICKSKKIAELEVAKLACAKLCIQNDEKPPTNPTKDEAPAKSEASSKKTSEPMVKDPEWITIEKIEDIYQYLTDEILAQEFKAFLHCRAQEDKQKYPVFTVEEVECTGYTGYTAKLTYNDVEYKSLGIMLTRKQAEQSAAEVCLRSIGDFPQVEKDKYTIQVYRGGQIHMPMGPSRKTVTAMKFNRILHIFIHMNSMQHATYRFKESVVTEGETEIKKYECVAHFEGKTFKTEEPHGSLAEAKDQVCEQALKFFHIVETEDAGFFLDAIRIRKNRSFVPIGNMISPLHFCPSKRRSWIFLQFNQHDIMTGVRLTYSLDKGNNISVKKPKLDKADEIVARILNATPRIGGIPIIELDDLCVGQSNKERQTDFLVGNSTGSIQLFCEEGQIMCNSKGEKVELKPGQTIKGLKCSYEVMHPSLLVYIKAQSCEDLIEKENSPPVVGGCGIAALVYDHESEVKDVQVLLVRTSNTKTFLLKAKHLAGYLREQLAPATTGIQSQFTVEKFCKYIDSWNMRELELLSRMTPESIKELISLYIKYDEKWNEIVGKEENEVLKEIKSAAINELARRTEENITEEGIADGEWLVPNVPFSHKVAGLGITVESPLLCAFRSTIQTTGLKVKVGEIESAPFVDVPLSNDDAEHSGSDVCRYHVWTALRKVSGTEDETYYRTNSYLEQQFGDEWKYESDFADKSKRKRPSSSKHNNNQKRKMMENESGEVKKVDVETKEIEEGEAATKEGEPTTVPMEEEKQGVEEGAVERDGPIKGLPSTPKQAVSIHSECQWFPLEEAIKVCPTLAIISKEKSFTEQVEALKKEASEMNK